MSQSIEVKEGPCVRDSPCIPHNTPDKSRSDPGTSAARTCSAGAADSHQRPQCTSRTSSRVRSTLGRCSALRAPLQLFDEGRGRPCTQCRRSVASQYRWLRVGRIQSGRHTKQSPCAPEACRRDAEYRNFLQVPFFSFLVRFF